MENLDLYALLPCPVKVAIESSFNDYLDKIQKEDNKKYNCLIEANANKNLAKKNFIDDYNSYNKIPSIVISAGVNDFYGKDFYNKFISKDLFKTNELSKLKNNIGNFEIQDPKSSYHILAMNVLVMVVDLTKIKDRNIPKSFGDLLDDSFINNVVIRGEKDKFCETTLLTIYKEYGMWGINKLGEVVKNGWHPSQMVQNIGKGLDDAPIVSVMPYFYSETIRNKDKVKVVWPKEGAIISPITMLIKRGKEMELQKIIDFFTGEEVGNIFSKANFKTLSKDVVNDFPKEATYNWIDWNFIWENDIKTLVKNLNKEFLSSYKKGRIVP